MKRLLLAYNPNIMDNLTNPNQPADIQKTLTDFAAETEAVKQFLQTQQEQMRELDKKEQAGDEAYIKTLQDIVANFKQKLTRIEDTLAEQLRKQQDLAAMQNVRQSLS